MFNIKMKNEFCNILKLIKLSSFSIYMLFWKLLFVVFTVLYISNFMEKLKEDIDNDISYIEKTIIEQITVVTEVFKDNSNNLINFIRNNKLNEEISRYLQSIEPRNSNIHISLFILLDQNLSFKASSYYSSEDQIEEYNKTLKDRKYILDTVNDCNNIKVGNVVKGFKTNKIAVPFGLGLCDDNKYYGTILTGIKIEELNREIKKYTKIQDLIFNGNSIKNSLSNSKLKFIHDVIFSKEDIIKITEKIPFLKENIIITYQKELFLKKMISFVLTYSCYIAIALFTLYYTRHMIRKEFIIPINKINDVLVTIDDCAIINHNLIKIEFDNINLFWNNINLMISKINSLSESFNQSKSALKFFIKDKIQEIKDADEEGYNLFKNIYDMQQFLKSSKSETVESNNICREFSTSIRNFYQNNLYIPNRKIIYELYVLLERVEDILEDIKKLSLSKNILNDEIKLLNNALIEFYQDQNYSGFYMIHSQYLKTIEKPEKCDIKLTLIDVIHNNGLQSDNISLNLLNLKFQNFSIYKKAFEFSFIYALKTLSSFYQNQNGYMIDIEFLSGDDYKSSLLAISFSINKISSDISTPNENMLYSCIVFSALNSGKVMLNRNDMSLVITYPFINLDR